MRKQLVAVALLALLGTGSSQAIDVISPDVKDISEAARFFAELLGKTRNPVIADMARESLHRIQMEDAAKAERKTEARSVTEVALLPQVDNTYVVPAVVNKKFMATFLVDTGASYTVITPQTAAALGVSIEDASETVPVTTANGTMKAPVVMLDNVSLGGMVVHHVEAVVANLGDAPQLSGLLGMSFFHGMEISLKQDRLLISR
jgi:clan AA aspartic protease (TIGR02281 family)